MLEVSFFIVRSNLLYDALNLFLLISVKLRFNDSPFVNGFKILILPLLFSLKIRSLLLLGRPPFGGTVRGIELCFVVKCSSEFRF